MIAGGSTVATVTGSAAPKLLESVRFPNPNEMFDLSVEYDRRVACLLKQEYARQEKTEARRARYADQLRDFLATLPSYLGSTLPDTAQRIWRDALAFPQPPAAWSGTIKLGQLQELRNRIK
jgi:hypothetical protein